jgi:DNA-binding PucR family transcriptional regulator
VVGEGHRKAAVADHRASARFIAGDPMKVATNRLTGASNRFCGRSPGPSPPAAAARRQRRRLALQVRLEGPSGPRATSFSEVAPLALMASSVELLRTWVHETLGQLADDDDQHARLRDTLRVFLLENGSFKATAERLILHKNSVQYRVRKAEEALGHPVADNQLAVELALLASQWLGATVLRHPRQPRP